jgi:hypothetical protein
MSVYRLPFRHMVVDPRLAFIVAAEASGDEKHQEVATQLMLNVSAHPEVCMYACIPTVSALACGHCIVFPLLPCMNA